MTNLPVLTEEHLYGLDRIVRDELDSMRAARAGSASANFSFDPAIVDFISSQLLLPLAVGLTGSTMYDVLKGQLLARLHPRDAKHIASGMVGLPVVEEPFSSADAVTALRDQLRPLGFGDNEIAVICRRAEEYVRSPSGTAPDPPGSSD